MAKINARSPYYIHDYVSDLTSDRIDIYIYTGTQTTDRPSDATYSLTSNAIDDKVTFEISELIKDYFINDFDGDYASNNYWIDYEVFRSVSGGAFTSQGIVQLTGFYGYGYFEDGANPQNADAVLQTNRSILKLADTPVVIPVDASKTSQVTYLKDGEIVYTFAVTGGSYSDKQIKYVTNGVNGADTFENRVVQDGGTFESNVCLTAFEDEFELLAVDEIRVSDEDGNLTIITVQNIEECKYQPYKVTFVNKFGALQDIWFFKRSNEILTTTKEEFKRNIAIDGSYNISKHQNKILTKNGSEKLTLNTGFYPEEYNKVFKEMQLSEDCWIEIENKTLPINVSSSSLNYKTHLNDKLINYTIEIDFAFDTINNIR